MDWGTDPYIYTYTESITAADATQYATCIYAIAIRVCRLRGINAIRNASLDAMLAGMAAEIVLTIGAWVLGRVVGLGPDATTDVLRVTDTGTYIIYSVVVVPYTIV